MLFSLAFQYLRFFFNDTATTEIYTLSLHDALPIFFDRRHDRLDQSRAPVRDDRGMRSEEHTSELQSRENLVCRRLIEKKKDKQKQKEDNKMKKEKNRRVRVYMRE